MIGKIPEPTYEPKYNNPVWAVPVKLDVERQDNAISLHQHLGAFSVKDANKPKETFDVSLAVGGWAFIIQSRASGNSYAIKMRDLLGALSLKLHELDKAPKKPHPRSRR